MSLDVLVLMFDAECMHSLVGDSGTRSPGSSLLRLCTADDISVGDIVLIFIRDPKFLFWLVYASHHLRSATSNRSAMAKNVFTLKFSRGEKSTSADGASSKCFFLGRFRRKVSLHSPNLTYQSIASRTNRNPSTCATKVSSRGLPFLAHFIN